MIEASQLSKTFRIPVAKEGPFGGIRTLFSREYKEKQAVAGVTFRIEPGEFVGYIGPNGAGKSTTIKMLTGILHPTGGQVRIHGISPQRSRRQVVRRIGVVFGQRTQLWWDLPVKDSYDILTAMYGLDAATASRRTGELRELLGMEAFWETPVRKLSLGQRMRADLAASMLHDPDILFLDEPTIGLDVIAKKSIREFLKTLNRDSGKTILLTTHDMDDIEQLCGRVIVINHGEKVFDGSIPELRDRIGLPTRIKVTFYDEPRQPDRSEPALFRIAEIGERSLTVECNRQDITAMDVLRQLSEWGGIEDVHMEEPDFEEVIHRAY